MSVKGFYINGSVQKYDYESLDNKPASGDGLTEQAKRALLACFEQVAWTGTDGKSYYDALEEALYPQGYVNVTNNLAWCRSTNEAITAAVGKPYTAAIIADSGYSLTGATVSITMGGTDVTGFYSNGAINISNVTGDLVITVTAMSAVSSITAVYTQSGTVYDTDTLDSLKADLVVMANYSDSSTQTVPAADYTISGTLTAGTSTITVSYGGKTATFTVSVSAYWDYEWYASSMSAPNGMTFETYDFTTDPGAMRVVSPNLDLNYIGAVELEVTMRPFALVYNKTTHQYEEKYYSNTNTNITPNNPQISVIYSMNDKIGARIIFCGRVNDVMCTRLLTGGTEVDINDDEYHSFRSVSENGSAKIYVDDILAASGQGFVSSYYEFTGIYADISFTAENSTKYCAYIKSIKFKRL